MPIAMVSTMRQTYMGRSLRSGEHFEAPNEAEASDLIAVNAARRAIKVASRPEAAPVARETLTRHMGTADGDETPPVQAASADEGDDVGEPAAAPARPAGLQSSTGKNDRYDHRAMRAKR